MSKTVKSIVIAAVVTILTVTGIGALAYLRPAAAAQAESAYSNLGGGRGFCGAAGLDAAAQALGMTSAEVQTQMRAGESLADLADTAGVDTQDVLDAVTAACNQATRESIEQAVTDGDLTRANADWLLEGLDKGYWGAGVRGFGFGGHGFGGPGGHGGEFGGPGNRNLTPTPAPAGDA